MATEREEVWQERLKCSVVSLDYDFRERTGRLFMAAANCCDMEGCLGLFRGIDPKVKAIVTFSGEKRDTVYRREDKKWNAYLP